MKQASICDTKALSHRRLRQPVDRIWFTTILISWTLQLVLCSIPYVQAAPSIANQIKLSTTDPALDEATGTYDSILTLTNRSRSTITGPLYILQIRATAFGVGLANRSGFDNRNRPFLTVNFPDNGLEPGQSIGGLPLKFTNPKRLPFKFKVKALKTLNTKAEVLSTPRARAGSPQTVAVGTSVTLDGSASTNPDGNQIAFRWTLVNRPAGSKAALVGADTPHPKFAVDVAGNYLAELVVANGEEISVSDRVIISTTNSAPIASPGAPFLAKRGETVTLDGSASFDVDGDPLSYTWTLENQPFRSRSQLVGADTPQPTLSLDRTGDYIISLKVNDGGLLSQSRLTSVKALKRVINGQFPISKAGPDQAVEPPGQPVSLDGRSSTDLDGDLISYRWAMIYKPDGSQAQLADPLAGLTQFTPDRPGTYIAQLMTLNSPLVIDNETNNFEEPDTVEIKVTVPTVPNHSPQFTSTPPTTATVGQPYSYQLAATDSDNDPLTYSLLVGGTDMLINDPTPGLISWTPTVPGNQPVSVKVDDGKAGTDTQSFEIAVSEPVNLPPQITSSAVTVGVIGQLYSYQVTAVDPEDDPLSYSLVTAPDGMTINNPSPGLVAWTPSADGTQTVTVKVDDGNTHSDTQTFDITVTQPPIPDLIGVGRNPAITKLQSLNFRVGAVTEANNATVPIGKVISQTPTPQSIAPAGTAVDLVISLGPAGGGGLPPDPVDISPSITAPVVTTVAASTSFLYSGTNRTQTGVAADTIDAKRAAVVRGRVLDPNGNPLPGVTVTVSHHPEFGQTVSRGDGRYDMAVNGGGLLTLDYRQTGRLSAQRQVQAPWQGYVQADDVALVARDAVVTNIDFTGVGAPQIAQGSVVTDASGTRKATVLFPSGTTAQIYNPDGTTKPAGNLHLRFTEFTVGENGPKAMPAPLPPTSAYTYAVGLDADEVTTKIAGKDVLFNQPVYFYLENFLNFPVGVQVPVGYYDEEKSTWVPSNDGRIVKIVAVANGLADIDSDGDGAADSGAELGITDAERSQLATLYSAGQTLQRVPVSHFSRYDTNYGSGCPASNTCPQPNPPDPKPIQDTKNKNLQGNGETCPPSGPTVSSGSIIECENQILGEEISLTATPFTLNYRSDRVPGSKASKSFTIPLTGDTPPGNLARIDLTVMVAGQTLQKSFSPTPNLGYTFEWDGKDAYGRELLGEQTATIMIGYNYPAVYNLPPRVAASFGLNSGVPVPGNVPARGGMTLTQSQTATVRAWRGSDSFSDQLGGWTLSEHHTYDPLAKLLYLGSGDRQGADATNVLVAKKFAGGGFQASGLQDGGPATSAFMSSPADVVVASNGDVFIADSGNHRIRRVDSDGIISTIAGTGAAASGGDGGPAVVATLDTPRHLAIGPDDSIYLDTADCRIRRIQPDGIITTVAGNGTCAIPGEDALAKEAPIDSIFGIAVGPDGSIYIANHNSQRIRRVGPDGVIRSFAGGPLIGPSGDGGPALNAVIAPIAVAADGKGNVYIGDDVDQSVRKISPDGIITTVAGGGTVAGSCLSFFCGDGGPALQARFQATFDLAIANDGSIYVLDNNAVVRHVGPDGIIRRVAGNGFGGSLGFAGDIEPALAADLFHSSGFTLDRQDNPIITGPFTGKVYKVSSSLPGFSGADLAVPSTDGTRLYQFDATGRHLRTLHALTGATLLTFVYDQAGRLSSVTDASGNVTTIERDAGGTATAIVAPFGQRTALTMDASGYLASVANPAGETHSITYSAGGLLNAFTDPRGNSSVMTYDAAGKLLTDTNAAGGGQTLARTDLNFSDYLAARTTALGRKTTHRVDFPGAGGMRRTDTGPDGTSVIRQTGADGSTQTSLPDGTSSSYQHKADPRFGLLVNSASSQSVITGGLTSTSSTERTVALADPTNLFSLTSLTDTSVLNGRASTSTYTAANKTFTATSAAGRTSSRVIDDLGRVAQTAVPGILPVNTAYDLKGRPARITQGSDADARTLSFAYNPQGFLASVTDSLGRTVGYEYDLAGRVTTQTLADGRQIHYGYDASGNLTSLQPPGKPAHAFQYTKVDQTADYSPPAIPNVTDARTLYAYDLDKALTSITRPDGQSLQFTYDAAGRLTSQKLQPADTTLASYAYDATTGKLSSITEKDGGILNYSYSGSLQTATSWKSSLANPVAGSVGFVYDNDFRVASVLVNGANPINYGYDADSLITGAGAETLSRHAQNGRLTGSSLGTVSDLLTYDAFGALASYTAKIGAASLFETQFTRDKLGRITQKQETIGGTTTTFDYGYDLAGRLSTVARNGVTQSTYTYDDNGNRLSKITSGGTETGTYDDQDRLLTYGGSTYTYTANGELTSKTTGTSTTTYQYDVLGNLKYVTLPDGTAIDYLVDGQNRRIGKKVNGTLVQGFLYQDQLKPIAELDGNNTVVSRFAYATHVNVPDYMIKGGVTYRIITDHLGSPRFVVNTADGSVAQQMEYDEFGNVLADSNPGFQPFGFAGGIYDRDIELVRFGARDYDAETGRWMVKDPVRFSGGINVFEYTYGDPINVVDEGGLAGSFSQTISADGGSGFGTIAPEDLACPKPDAPKTKEELAKFLFENYPVTSAILITTAATAASINPTSVSIPNQSISTSKTFPVGKQVDINVDININVNIGPNLGNIHTPNITGGSIKGGVVYRF
jgi:RHS repeat-associated protein